MVVSTSPQTLQTYRLWKQFSMPIGEDTVSAVAVPKLFSTRLISVYTILMTTMILNIWCILSAAALFMLLKRGHSHYLATSLWNKRASMLESFMEVSLGNREQWRKWWIYPVMTVVLGCWICQIIFSIFVPSFTAISNAAPVNADAIFVPSFQNKMDTKYLARLFPVDASSGLRAAGSAQVASQDIQTKIRVEEVSREAHDKDEIKTKIEYSYTVSGTDFGLQKYPTLKLKVTGACTTDYTWFIRSRVVQNIPFDSYQHWDKEKNSTYDLFLQDGKPPVAYFYPLDISGVNTTWVAYVSSVNRTSYSSNNDDPIYRTMDSGLGENAPPYRVRPARPVLSCWQTDEWKYKDHTVGVLGLNSSIIPGLDLPESLQNIFAHYLGVPKITSLGTQLGQSALVSSNFALGYLFDAHYSSILQDMKRLVLASYIATCNTLTDTTLYPENRRGLRNIAHGNDSKPAPGVGDFVVWSSDVATLSIVTLVVVPVMSVLLSVAVFVVLTWTPLRRVNALDAVVLHRTLQEKYPEAIPSKDGVWKTENAEAGESIIPLNDCGNRDSQVTQSTIQDYEPIRTDDDTGHDTSPGFSRDAGHRVSLA